MELGTIRRQPSVPTLQAADLNWLIGEYLSWQRTQVDKCTVDCCASTLSWFRRWWEEVGPSKDWLLRQADLEDFERFLRAAVSKRTQRKLSWNTRNDVVRRLREMLHWAKRKGYMDRDYAEWVPKVEGGPPKRRAAGITALMQLLLAADLAQEAVRDKAMLAMMMGMGLRRCEVANLNVEDVIVEADGSGYAHVHGKRTKANPRGERDAAFDAKTGKIILAHLDSCAYGRGPLFRNNRDERLSTQGVYRATKRLIVAAGLEEEIQACHDLRRAFATYAARRKRGTDNADRLRRQLGHSSYSQSADYTLLDVDDLRVDFVSPLSDMPRSVFS